MAGLRFEANISTRHARAALPVGIHWRSIDPDIHLGYRKQKRGGRWVVRWHAAPKKYRQETLATVDDVVKEGNLSFDQATKLAREKVTDARAAAARAAQPPPQTVRSVLETYIEMRNARRSAQAGRKTRSDAASRIGLHILQDAISDVELSSLTEDDLFAWKTRLSRKLKPTSRLRTLSDFRSALNIAHLKYRKHLPPEFGEIVRYGLRRDEEMTLPSYGARNNQILGDDLVRKIIAAAASHDQDGDIWRMILVLAATGARFSQVQRLQVQDFQCERSRLLMPTSRKGRNRADEYYPIQIGADVVAALAPIVDGRRADEPLLCRWRYIQTGIRSWRKDRRGPWTSASELTRPWKAICSTIEIGSVAPYALRHSSIVRSIRMGLPIRLVAALHDTSVAMIERHYARSIVDGLEELATKAVVPLVTPQVAVQPDLEDRNWRAQSNGTSHIGRVVWSWIAYVISGRRYRSGREPDAQMAAGRW